MSCSVNDENLSLNVEGENRTDRSADSGYLTLLEISSPQRLSPSRVIAADRLDSPQSEHEVSSPFIGKSRRKFLSTIDYEKYISTRKHFDILTQLHHRNSFHLISEILQNLSPTDLQSCLQVSRNWHRIVHDYQHREEKVQVKRNLFKSFDRKKKYSLTSTPMQSITNLLETKPLKNESKTSGNTLSLAASSMTCRYGYLKYLHGPTVPKRCPICAYVSIVDVNDQHGICTNPLCGNSFCHCCSGPYHHPSSPCKTSTGPIKSPWRQRPNLSPIFSQKTRSNLRRLLIR